MEVEETPTICKLSLEEQYYDIYEPKKPMSKYSSIVFHWVSEIIQV